MGIREMAVLAILALILFVAQMERTDAAVAGIEIDVTSTSRVESSFTPSSGRLSRSHELDSVDELFVDEPTRRILAARNSYVSYGALNRNRSPCPSSGYSYYSSCRNNGPVQPYRRSCVQITRCARG